MTGMGYPGMPMGGVGMEAPAEPSGLQVRAGGGGGGRGPLGGAGPVGAASYSSRLAHWSWPAESFASALWQRCSVSERGSTSVLRTRHGHSSLRGRLLLCN